MFERWLRRRRLRRDPGEDATLARSGLFDAAYYLARNRDVAEAGLSPLAHFCEFGWREGRWPNPAFDPAWYARVAGLGPDENPLSHYWRCGEAAGLRPICFFDPRHYRDRHAPPNGQSALAHFLAARAASAPAADRAPPTKAPISPADEDTAIAVSGLFDASLYLVEGPDIREAGWEPLAHYRCWGWREGRRPNLYFDPVWYRARHLEGAEVEPLAHYLRVGEAAGLRPIATFEPDWYRRHYALPPGTSALAHFLANRRSQRYAPNRDFDLDFYLARHGAALGPNRDPFAHFLLHGSSDDFDPSAAFDSAAYRAERMKPRHDPPAAGSARWAAAERNVPFVHWLDGLPEVRVEAK